MSSMYVWMDGCAWVVLAVCMYVIDVASVSLIKKSSGCT
jgi:hypothetical protein